MQKAQEQIAKHPGHYPYYNELAMACARRARETSDAAWYGKSEEALKRSFAIAPDNFEGLKVWTWLLLGRHEFARALESATRLNQRTPDDITVYGYLADANVELGNYDAAVAAAVDAESQARKRGGAHARRLPARIARRPRRGDRADADGLRCHPL